jgi:hypothetical protein
MTLQHQPSIEGFFDFRSKNSDGSFSMYQWTENSKDRLYIVNQHRKKLLQFVVKDEPHANQPVTFAQIKIIPYVVERAKVYNDQPGDPILFRIYSELELTYHGGSKGDHTPKIHLKIAAPSKNRYRTLVDCSLCLDSSIPRLAPICSFFSGYEYDKPMTVKISKKSHKFKVDSTYPVRFDIYLSGKDFDHHAYINSMYSMSMFFSLDYLIAKENSPLQGLPIVQPIMGFAMKGYYLWVRCSKSMHEGKAFIQFYNNADYYEKIMNRRTAWIDKNGRTHWSTMIDEERRITDDLRNEILKNKS